VPFVVTTAIATTISFSPLNLDDETLLFHNSSGTLVAVYNTSTKGIVLDNNESYSILIQPSSSNLLVNHPDQWFSNFIAWGSSNNRFIGLLMLFFLAAIIILAYKRR
jgi:hypothetical protein